MDTVRSTGFICSVSGRLSATRLKTVRATGPRRAFGRVPVALRRQRERLTHLTVRPVSRSLLHKSKREREPVMAVREIETQEEMEQALTDAGDALVVVDYGTTWCGPCKLMEPKLESWSEEYTGVVFLKVVGDKSKETSMMMKAAGIRSVPSFHFYKKGERIHTINGAKAEEILSSIETHM
jgi:thioredoxin 1